MHYITGIEEARYKGRGCLFVILFMQIFSTLLGTRTYMFGARIKSLRLIMRFLGQVTHAVCVNITCTGLWTTLLGSFSTFFLLMWEMRVLTLEYSILRGWIKRTARSLFAVKHTFSSHVNNIAHLGE